MSVSKKVFDQLVSSAIYTCKSYEDVSTALFQRTLMTDCDHAKVVVGELIKIKLMIDCRIDRDEAGYENVICKVNKQKLRELSAN